MPELSRMDNGTRRAATRWPLALWLRAVLLVAVVVAVGNTGLQAETNGAPALTLTASLEKALLLNRDLRRQMLRVESAKLGVDAAQSAFAWRVGPSADVGTTSGDPSVGGGFNVGKRLRWGTDVGVNTRLLWQETDVEAEDAFYAGRVSIGIEQPLFRDFGRAVNEEPVVMARSQARGAQRAWHAARMDTVLRVAEAYVDILRLERKIEIDTRFRDRTETLHRLTQAKERQGMATRVDALRVELQLGEANARLVTHRELLGSRITDFRELLGFADDAAIALQAVPDVEQALPSLVEARGIALSNRLDYAQALDSYVDAARQSGLAKRALQPRISLVTRYERLDDGYTASSLTRFGDDQWFVGLSADTDLVKTRERVVVSQAEMEKAASFYDIDTVRTMVARQVEQELLASRRAVAEVAIAERNVLLATSRARLARKLFAMGKGDNFTVTDAEDAALESEEALLNARADKLVMTYRLRRVLGTLLDVPSDLKSPAVKGAD